MEWVDGGSLAEHLRGKPRSEREAAILVAQLAQAVHHAHQCGVVHRDLKPANILLQRSEVRGQRSAKGSRPSDSSDLCPLTSDLCPKISDFGLAKLLDRGGMDTRPGQWLGTPEYMAPEQVGDEAGRRRVGPAVDVHALGVVLYEILTGRPPFQAHEPLETLRQVRHEEPVAPRRLRPRLAADLETICLKCLHKEPGRRYPSAQALAEDLNRWLQGRPIQARPTGAGERLVKWARRHPERAGLVALTTALILTLAIGSFWQFWASNAHYARQLAGSADYQLLLVKYAVAQTAQDGELRELLAQPRKDQQRWQKYLERIKQDFMRWFTRPGENPPIINWFVMDPAGTIVADSYEDPKSVGKNYRFRDYYTGPLRQDAAADPTAVYVSRVYESEQDDRFKFTVITRITKGERLLGLLGASLAVDAKLVALDMRKEAPGACLVGPIDLSTRQGQEDPSREPPRYAVVLHRDYSIPGQKPALVAEEHLDTLQAIAQNPELVHATVTASGNGCLVNYVRVGQSHFVTIVEQPYPWPIYLILRHPLAWVSGLAAAVAGIAFVSRGKRARHAAAEPRPSESVNVSAP